MHLGQTQQNATVFDKLPIMLIPGSVELRQTIAKTAQTWSQSSLADHPSYSDLVIPEDQPLKVTTLNMMREASILLDVGIEERLASVRGISLQEDEQKITRKQSFEMLGNTYNLVHDLQWLSEGFSKHTNQPRYTARLALAASHFDIAPNFVFAPFETLPALQPGELVAITLHAGLFAVTMQYSTRSEFEGLGLGLGLFLTGNLLLHDMWFRQGLLDEVSERKVEAKIADYSYGQNLKFARRGFTSSVARMLGYTQSPHRKTAFDARYTYFTLPHRQSPGVLQFKK